MLGKNKKEEKNVKSSRQTNVLCMYNCYKAQNMSTLLFLCTNNLYSPIFTTRLCLDFT